jgi:hypothetical protein
MLTKDDVLKAVKLRHEDVQVDEWGGTVRVSEMTAGAYDRYQRSLYRVKGTKIEQDLSDMTTSYLQACLVNEDGTPMFSLDEIKSLPAKPIVMLYDKAQEVNGDNKKAKDEIAKNSVGGQNA